MHTTYITKIYGDNPPSVELYLHHNFVVLSFDGAKFSMHFNNLDVLEQLMQRLTEELSAAKQKQGENV